jgi:four helix bundle protein
MHDHKSLLAWQQAKAVVHLVMLATLKCRQPYAVVDQLQRAALSVQLNIAEGYAFKTERRFRNHLDIAYASAVETAELLELSGDLNLFPSKVARDALEHCRQSQRLLLGLIRRLRRD